GSRPPGGKQEASMRGETMAVLPRARSKRPFLVGSGAVGAGDPGGPGRRTVNFLSEVRAGKPRATCTRRVTPGSDSQGERTNTRQEIRRGDRNPGKKLGPDRAVSRAGRFASIRARSPGGTSAGRTHSPGVVARARAAARPSI